MNQYEHPEDRDIRIETIVEHNGGIAWQMILVYVRGKYFGRHRPAQHGLPARNFFAEPARLVVWQREQAA